MTQKNQPPANPVRFNPRFATNQPRMANRDALEAVARGPARIVGSAKESRGSKCMIKHWFVPPIVIPILIVLGLVVYVTVRAFY